MKHDYLVLSLMLVAPGALVLVLRPDLRRAVLLAAAASVPFAATERFFYGVYWTPSFAFDLVHLVGFGVEDVLCVTGLAASMTASYPVATRRRLLDEGSLRASAGRAAAAVTLTLALALALMASGIAPIFAAYAAMLTLVVGMVGARRDLLVPALVGGTLSALLYAATFLAYRALDPEFVARVWHTERLIHRFVVGVPVEELLYGWTAGTAGSIFYAYASGARFAPLAPPDVQPSP